MLFNSLEFLVFLAVTLTAHWLLPHRYRHHLLLLGSLFFYGYWLPRYIPLLLGLVAVGWGAALLYARRKNPYAIPLGIVLALSVLCYWKYTAFLLKALHPLLASLGFTFDPTTVHIELPLGISFITFQVIAYMVDVRRGELAASRSYREVLLFVCYFPHLIAGPICRGHQLIPQLERERTLKWPVFARGFFILSAGLLLKAAFADNLAPYVDVVYKADAPSSANTAFMATLAFGIQIFCDFWGYSTMAVGMGMMFGILLPNNFNLPYLATSLQDFWRRWHITLSSWLRDYLYKPLGGSRKGTVRTACNLVITMALGGLWHGANTTFIVWGLIHGFALVAERMLKTALAPVSGWMQRIRLGGVVTACGWLFTMVVVFTAWIFFRADTSADALVILNAILKPDVWKLDSAIPPAVPVLMAVFALLQVPVNRLIMKGREGTLPVTHAAVLAFWCLVATVIFSAGDTVPFIYFQF